MPDTNIVSLLMRGDARLHARLESVRQAGMSVILSPVVEYEVRRGLLWRRAPALQQLFEKLRLDLVPKALDLSAWLKAAELWAYSRSQAFPLPDADILIAAHAINLSAVLVTNNERHFRLFQPHGLQMENWTTP
jgi:predicted nucleic acid-binding protein